jgi:hypothetical protein
MYEFTETILVEAPPTRAWEVMSDIESWWPAANPEHVSMKPFDDSGVRVGAQFEVCEKVAGIPGEAVRIITVVKPGLAVTWEAPEARYRWYGIPMTISEGVSWRIEQREDQGNTQVSARVWVEFRLGILGSACRWAFVRLLNGIEKDREHARTELRYLKRLIETGQ